MVPIAKKYGDTFTLPGSPPLVCTGDPAAIRAIYTADPDTFEPLSQDLAVFLGRSILLMKGDEHRRTRKLMMPPFHGTRMRTYGDQIRRISEQHTAHLRAEQRVKMLELARQISLDVILQAIFGVTEPARMAVLSTLLLEIVSGISPLVSLVPALRRELGGFGPFATWKRLQRRLFQELDALIAAGKAKGPREDILSLLIEARDDDDQPMSHEEIRDQLVLLVIAGHETTATSIAWAFYALHRPENAAALERLRAELEALGPSAEPEAVARLPYLEAVCQETLRRYPVAPAPSPRRLLAPLTLAGYSLPAGVGVSVGIGIVHFREDLYPDPMRFRPERFLERQFSPFEYVPFGGGARRCLGAALAGYEMKLVIAGVLRRFRLRLESLRPDSGAARAANVGPAHAVRMVVEERLS